MASVNESPTTKKAGRSFSASPGAQSPILNP
jgi:hypothetical protein